LQNATDAAQLLVAHAGGEAADQAADESRGNQGDRSLIQA